MIVTIDGPAGAGKSTVAKTVAAKLGSRFLRMGWLPAPHDEKPVEIWGHSREEWMANRNKESRA